MVFFQPSALYHLSSLHWHQSQRGGESERQPSGTVAGVVLLRYINSQQRLLDFRQRQARDDVHRLQLLEQQLACVRDAQLPDVLARVAVRAHARLEPVVVIPKQPCARSHAQSAALLTKPPA
jgi:hypothetical protein